MFNVLTKIQNITVNSAAAIAQINKNQERHIEALFCCQSAIDHMELKLKNLGLEIVAVDTRKTGSTYAAWDDQTRLHVSVRAAAIDGGKFKFVPYSVGPTGFKTNAGRIAKKAADIYEALSGLHQCKVLKWTLEASEKPRVSGDFVVFEFYC